MLAPGCCHLSVKYYNNNMERLWISDFIKIKVENENCIQSSRRDTSLFSKIRPNSSNQMYTDPKNHIVV